MSAPLNSSQDFYQFQSELLRHAVYDTTLAVATLREMKVDDWVNPIQAFLFSCLRATTQQNNAIVVPFPVYAQHVLKAAKAGGTQEAAMNITEFEALADMMDFVSNSSNMAPAYFANELPNHLRALRLQRIQAESSNLSTPEEVRAYLDKVKALESVSDSSTRAFHIDSAWQNPELALTRDTTQHIRIPTSVQALNASLGGGLGRGEVGIVIAAPGVGKTNKLINLDYAANSYGIRSLMLSGEMAGRRIKHRYHCVSAHIPGDLIKLPLTEWRDKGALDRLRFMQEHYDPSMFSLVDASAQPMTISFIDRVIETWLTKMEREFGPKANAYLVTVDWLEYIVCDNEDPRKRGDEILKERAKAIGVLARRYQVGLWTAHQANREGAGKDLLRMNDTAGGYLINQATDVSVGLSAPQDKMFRDTAGKGKGTRKAVFTATQNEDDETTITRDNNYCRELNYSTMKFRDSEPISGKIYQGNTLRFWDSKAESLAATRALQEKGPEALLSSHSH